MNAATSPTIDGFHVRAASFLPLRAAYVRDLTDRVGIDPRDSRALVVGAGRGLLARELARQGFVVSALEPDPSVSRIGQRAADEEEAAGIDFQIGDAARLTYPDESFDIGHWADTLEVTPDLDTVLAEAARVLRPGGVFIYDTVARTAVSRVLYLGALQAWGWTRIAPSGRYAGERLRDPDKLARELARHGLRSDDVRGFEPANPIRLVQALRRARRGGVDDSQLADLAGMRLAAAGKRPVVTYLGYAVKRR